MGPAWGRDSHDTAAPPKMARRPVAIVGTHSHLPDRARLWLVGCCDLPVGLWVDDAKPADLFVETCARRKGGTAAGIAAKAQIMNTSLILALVWLVVANVAAMFPSKRSHWPTAYVLLAIGLPLLVWVFMQNGWLIALTVLVAAGSVLRWPVLFLWRWLRRQVQGARQ